MRSIWQHPARLRLALLYLARLIREAGRAVSGRDRTTGLANPAQFRAAAHRALVRGARTGRFSAVLVIEHKSDDLVLIEFAHLLRRTVPEPGRPARLGGAEFAVALPSLGSPEEAYEVAGQIAAAVGPVIVNGRLINMAASIGVAVSAPGELTHDVLVHRATQAMDRARRFAPETRWAAWRESSEPDARQPAPGLIGSPPG